MIEPRNDYLLVRRAEAPQGLIIRPDIAQEKSLYGEVLAVGPGRWFPGQWWNVRKVVQDNFNGIPMSYATREWEWIPGHRQPPSVHVGQKILFNSKWNDFAANFEDDLPLGADARLHLIQEGDIFSIF